ncbi:MAG: hypothetical protein AAF389_18725, partial [Gemmatimonadota bacterium]
MFRQQTLTDLTPCFLEQNIAEMVDKISKGEEGHPRVDVPIDCTTQLYLRMYPIQWQKQMRQKIEELYSYGMVKLYNKWPQIVGLELQIISDAEEENPDHGEIRARTIGTINRDLEDHQRRNERERPKTENEWRRIKYSVLVISRRQPWVLLLQNVKLTNSQFTWVKNKMEEFQVLSSLLLGPEADDLH